jgi:hypothetical protein
VPAAPVHYPSEPDEAAAVHASGSGQLVALMSEIREVL